MSSKLKRASIDARVKLKKSPILADVSNSLQKRHSVSTSSPASPTAPPIEAHSLNLLHDLADSPSPNPLDLQLKGLAPLVLYIGPVPGSRNVFLTTTKPRGDRVTAEDISSAFYIFHHDDIENFQYQVKDEEKNDRDDPKPNGAKSRFGIRRKPLASEQISEGSEEGLRLGASHSRRPSSTSTRHHSPVDVGQISATTERDQLSLPNSGSPEPFADRTPDSTGFVDPFTKATVASIQDLAPEYSNSQGICLHRRGLITGSDAPMSLLRLSRNQPVVAKVIDPSAAQSFRRRSSMSGEQSNHLQSKGAMYVDMISMGYTGLEMDTSYIGPRAITKAFTRRVFRDEDGSPPSTPSVDNRTRMSISSHQRNSSDVVDVVQSTEGGVRDSLKSAWSKVLPRNRYQRGYIFQSPWGSRCHFIAGDKPNVLKCLEENVVISELRFHMAMGHRDRLHPPGRNSSEVELGQALGGGVDGEQAKLAKLLIYDEGFKMLDLLVAVNMLMFSRGRNLVG